MKKKVAVVGASLGGLVAASELCDSGCEVTIFERGKTAGGLYNKVETPFGVQELGMHVVYASEEHYAHLSSIFGEEVFNVLRGTKVDIGACTNFGEMFFGSLYPNLLGHPDVDLILSELLKAEGKEKESTNAREEVINRFGAHCGAKIVAPILEKLWKTNPQLLTRQFKLRFL